MALIEFSRNGWHGVISDEITFENITIVAQAVADYLNDTRDKGAAIVLGYDTRFLSREYAWVIQRVLTGNGLKVYLHKKPIPTSFISLSVRLYQADLGIMVTGEGRPARYSGLTFKLGQGEPASEMWMSNLFNYLYRRYPRSSDDNRALLHYIDVNRDYTNLANKYLDFSLMKEQRPLVVSDSFFGSVGTYFQDILNENGVSGVHIRTKANPGFLDSIPQPNDRNMQPLSRLITQKRGNIGLFFNGDGSQLGVVTSNGEILSSLWISAIALYEWISTMGNKYDVYTELFTPQIAIPILDHYQLKEAPLYKLYEGSSDFSRAIIWERQSLTFGGFLPEKDGMFQGLLLLRALYRNEMDWKKLMHNVQVLAGQGYMEQKSINMDGNTWNRKRSAIMDQKVEFIKEGTVINIEEDKDLKLWLSDGSWLGFSHNPKDCNLSIFYDTASREASEGYFPAVISWLLE